jgi:hypothetical protein
MIGYAEAPGAFWRARGMARAAGVALPRAVVEGWLTRSELAQIVQRCEICGAAVACTSWQAAADSASPPETCANKAPLDALSGLR